MLGTSFKAQCLFKKERCGEAYIRTPAACTHFISILAREVSRCAVRHIDVLTDRHARSMCGCVCAHTQSGCQQGISTEIESLALGYRTRCSTEQMASFKADSLKQIKWLTSAHFPSSVKTQPSEQVMQSCSRTVPLNTRIPPFRFAAFVVPSGQDWHCSVCAHNRCQEHHEP